MPLSSEERKRIEYLQQRLEGFRIQLEKLEKYLSGPNPEAANAKIRLQILSPIFESALKYSEELRVLQPRNPQMEVFEAAESRYYTAAASAESLQGRQQPVMNDTLNTTAGVSGRQEFPNLPKVQLPTFDGKQENWAAYKNRFLTLVHSRTDISDAVKCTQLFNTLTGPAMAKVAQFDPSEEDYTNAWKTLLEFYDHKRIITMKHLDALLDLPQLTKTSADDLATLLDTLRPNLHILEGLGARSSDEHLLVRIIERSLPPAVRSKWQDKLSTNDLPKLDDLIQFIQKTIFKQQAFDYSNQSQRNPQQKRPEVQHAQSSKKPKRNPAHTFVTASISNSTASTDVSMVCPMCRGAHRLFKCSKFHSLQVPDRRKFIEKIRACQNCLWDHPLPCDSQRRCKECKGEHHTLLHSEQGSNLGRSTPGTSLGNNA